MERISVLGMVVILVFLLLAGCAPAAAPAPAPAPVQPAEAPAAPALTPEETAWAKVVTEAKKEGKVTIYSFSFIGGVGQALARAFKESQGLSLELVTGPGAVFLERLKTEGVAGKNVADILEGSSANAVLAKQAGLSQTFGSLPVLKDTGVWMFGPRVDPENHLIYYGPSLQTSWANTRLVGSAEEPHSWRDLLDPKWKGKILSSDPNVMPINNQLYIVLTRKLGFDDEYFRALGRQDLIIVATARERGSRLARGEASLAWVESAVVASPLVVEGAPIRPLDMREGVAASGTTLNIAAGAPHPNAARVFMNWLLTVEGQTIQASTRNVLPLRTDVPDFTPPAARVKFTRVILLTPKDDEDAARTMRERVLSRLWGRQ